MPDVIEVPIVSAYSTDDVEGQVTVKEKKKKGLEDNFGKLPPEAGEWLVDLYASMREEGLITQSTEHLAYTDEFEGLYSEVQAAYPEVERKWVFRKLCSMRKQGNAKTRTGKTSCYDDGRLSVGQVRILRALDKLGEPSTLRQIAAESDVPLHSLPTIMGPRCLEDAEKVEKASGKPSLRGKGYVKATREELDGKEVTLYYISGDGKKALKAELEKRRQGQDPRGK